MNVLKIHQAIEIAVRLKNTWAAPYTVSLFTKLANQSANIRVGTTIHD